MADDVCTRLVNKSTHIPAAEKPAVIAAINAISDSYGICRDWLPIIFVMESGDKDGTMDPHTTTGIYTGLYQMGTDTLTDLRTEGLITESVTHTDLGKMTALQQLKYIGLSLKLKSRNVQPKDDLATIYLATLYPANMRKFVDEPDRPFTDAPLQWGRQAQGLFNANKQMTRNSLKAGLLAKAGVFPGTGPGGCNGLVADITAGTSTSIATPTGQGGDNNRVISITKTNCPTWDYRAASAKVLTGCDITAVSSGYLGGKTNNSPGSGGVLGAIANALGVPGADVMVPPGAMFLNPCGPDANKVSVQTSPYGMRWGRPHIGIDIASFGAKHIPIYAIADGVVAVASEAYSGYGLVVDIDHRVNGQAVHGIVGARYAHNTTLMVKPGQPVKAGQQIATMGNTGVGTGVHLHFEMHTVWPLGFRSFNTTVNPAPWITPKSNT